MGQKEQGPNSKELAFSSGTISICRQVCHLVFSM